MSCDYDHQLQHQHRHQHQRQEDSMELQRHSSALLHLPLDPPSPATTQPSSVQPKTKAGRGRRNMKQASLSAFSASDLRQTFNGVALQPFVATAATATAETAPTAAPTVGNKSRARSGCAPVSTSAPSAQSTFKPAPTSTTTTTGQQQQLELLKQQRDERRAESERPSESELIHGHLHKEIRPSSFVVDNVAQQLIFHNNNNPSLASTASQQLQRERNDNRREISERKMSRTVQSIQSLSMQLNRAASLSASLDDTMSVSREISGASSSQQGRAASKKLTKLVGKKAGRMKEILLQNLGKAHRTTDELFEMYEENFYKQQAQAVRIQKEFKSYMSSLKGAQDAGKNLNVCIQQSTGVYQSARHDLVCENLSQLDILNEDLLEKLRGQIQVSLSEYMSQFSELREKILKRKRKLIDYDSSRRVYEIMLGSVQRKRQQQQPQDQRPSFKMRSSPGSSPGPAGPAEASIQSAASQLVDEARLLKLREQYNYCKIMFETINSELYQELPMVYEKKMKHLLMTLQNYFSLEAQYHSNAGKLFATAGDVIDELPMSIHRSQQQNPLNQQQQQQLQQHQTTVKAHNTNDTTENNNNNNNSNHDDEYITNHKASGSSGMGSSRGDSSLESSSSPDNSLNDGSAPSSIVVTPQPRAVVDSRPNSAPEAAQQDKIEIDSAVEVGDSLSPGKGQIDDELAMSGACDQLDSLSMDFGDSSVSESVDTNDLEALKRDFEVASGDEQQASTASEGSSCSVIEFKPVLDSDQKEESTENNSNIKAAAADVGGGGASGGFLYKVKTSYKYLAEDMDELCFEANEIIQVIEFDENQDQEEGWLMGVREVNGQRGLFPANFTTPII